MSMASGGVKWDDHIELNGAPSEVLVPDGGQ